MRLHEILVLVKARLDASPEHVTIERGDRHGKNHPPLDGRSQAHQHRFELHGRYAGSNIGTTWYAYSSVSRGWLGEQWSSWASSDLHGIVGFQFDDVLATDWRFASEESA